MLSHSGGIDGTNLENISDVLIMSITNLLHVPHQL
jgi:hypothetical protein